MTRRGKAPGRTPWRALVVAVAIATSGSSARAAPAPGTCGAPSPTLDALGEAYYRIAPGEETEGGSGMPYGARGHGSSAAPDDSSPAEPLPRALTRLIERLHAAELEGRDGERTRCVGEGEEVREIGWIFDLVQLERVETLDERSVLTAFESRHTVLAPADDRRVDGTLVAESVDLPERAAWRPGADRASLHASRRFRRVGAESAFCAAVRRPETFAGAPTLDGERRARRCVYLTEIDTVARAVGRGLEISQTIYVNGLRSERVVWRMDS